MSRSALIYTVLGVGAILLLVGLGLKGTPPPEPAAAPAQMPGLSLHSAPRDLPHIAYHTSSGPAYLSDATGTITVVNFWANWCAPCREEMPALDALSTSLDGVEVITIATGRTTAAQAERFLSEIGAAQLPRHVDDQGLARALGIMGLPVTLIVDQDGREIGRVTGGADWNGPQARAMLADLAAR